MKVNGLTLASSLFDQTTFYPAFIRDLECSHEEIIIERPLFTSKRMSMLIPVIERAVHNGIKVYVLTRDPREHADMMVDEAELIIEHFEAIGVHTFLYTGNDHRKLAIIDRDILWEGSLNILSQTYSREVMRRTESRNHVIEMFNFLKLDKIYI